MVKFFVLLIALIVVGCATPDPIVITETVEVEAPYYVEREAPAWLAEPYKPESLPEFIAPGNGAVVGLSKEGAEKLRELIRTLYERDGAWRDWATD